MGMPWAMSHGHTRLPMLSDRLSPDVVSISDESYLKPEAASTCRTSVFVSR